MSRVIQIADELRALATTGLHFTEGPFDRERYDRLLVLAAELASLGGAGERALVLDLYRAADQGYVTPKLDVRMALFRGDRVLLVRERVDGRWCMPGGFVDVGDSPTEAAARETIEEAVRAGMLRAVDDAQERGDLGGITARIVRGIVERAPLQWLIDGGQEIAGLFD